MKPESKAPPPCPPSAPKTRSSSVRALVFLLLLAVCVGLSFHPTVRSHLDPDGLRRWVRQAGSVGLGVYVIALIVGEILWMPRMVLITAGGLLFPPLWAGLLSVAADMIAGAMFYALAAGMGRPFVRSLLARSPKLARAVELVSDNHGVAAVALLRICPVAHYTAFSYACGLTDVKLRPYLAGTFLGVLPGAMLYPFFGSAVLNPGSPVFWLAATSLIVFLGGTLWLGKRIVVRAEARKTVRSG